MLTVASAVGSSTATSVFVYNSNFPLPTIEVGNNYTGWQALSTRGYDGVNLNSNRFIFPIGAVKSITLDIRRNTPAKLFLGALAYRRIGTNT